MSENVCCLCAVLTRWSVVVDVVVVVLQDLRGVVVVACSFAGGNAGAGCGTPRGPAAQAEGADYAVVFLLFAEDAFRARVPGGDFVRAHIRFRCTSRHARVRASLTAARCVGVVHDALTAACCCNVHCAQRAARRGGFTCARFAQRGCLFLWRTRRTAARAEAHTAQSAAVSGAHEQVRSCVLHDC
jgi:hypothetical protein